MKLKSIYKALSYCSDLLNYPDRTAVDKIDLLKELIPDLNHPQSVTTFQKQEQLFKTERLTDLETEYISLFVTSVNGINCVPYASWWVENKLMGEETVQIENFYERCGFKLDPEIIKGPPDHIALEIGFLSRLLEEKMLSEANQMINEHLDWVNSFSKCIHQNSKLSLYPIVTQTIVDIITYLKKEEL